MKIRLLALVMVCLLSSAVLAQESPSPTPTASATPLGSYIVRADIYVRGGPSEHYLPVGSLVAGNVVQPLSRNAAATWVLIAYGRGFGWIRRDLAYWAINVDALPVFDETNLTPTTLPGSETPTPFFVTPTPLGNWVNVGPQGAYLRAGPGTRYPILGELQDGDGVEPVGRDSEGEWILIRFGEGFAWISRLLVYWVDDLRSLPVLLPSALTPTATYTGTLTPTDTPTASQTPSSTITASPSDTSTPIPTSTPTITASPTAIPTDSPIPSDTPTLTNTATRTETPTDVPTEVPPTDTATSAPSETATPIESSTTPEPSATDTSAPTETPTETSTETPLPSDTPAPSDTATNTATEAQPTATDTPSPTVTPVPPSDTPAAVAAAPTDTPVWELTATRIALETVVAVGQATVDAMQTAAQTEIVVLPTETATPAPSQTPSPTIPPDMIGVAVPTGAVTPDGTTPSTGTPDAGRIPVELIVGAVGLLLVVGYAGLYWRGLASLERYANGFVIEQCPVCGRGELMVETRHDRMFGIPRGRTTVRCSVCRSVLREAGNRRWRYAVDRIENPALYERFNGRVVDEATLRTLQDQPPAPRPAYPRAPTRPPKFEDEE